MRNFISEDDIEQAILQKLEGDPFQYGILRCDPSPDKRELLPDGTGRSSKKECVLPLVLRETLARLNPGIPGKKLEEIARDLCRDFSATDMTATNYKYYNQIRNGIKISLRRNGKEDFDFVKMVDFDCPENNTFTAVSQMWIQGRIYWRRPDVLIFINGLPMVFVELKNSIVKVEEAYNDNLKNYLRDIPNLFAFNQICVLSNGLETRLGAFNATYNHFFEWLKVNSEKERPDRQALKEADENEKFQKQGLDISMHRQKMNAVTPEGLDIEDRFKDPDDPLQLVFVCAMWLTGFDVENLSTLYLDKPMKGHTLMQAIARANRVYPGKPCGIIVDYVNVFKYMQKALTEYAAGDDGTEFPAKDIDQLIVLLNSAVDEADDFLLSLGIDIGAIVAEASTLDRLDLLREAYNTIISNDENKDKFKVILNTLMNLYEASRPEIFEKNWQNEKFSPLAYLYGLFCHTIDDEKINRARLRMAQVLDTSVSSQKAEDNDAGLVIHQGEVIDLSKVDVEELKKEIKVAKYKAVEIDDLKVFIEQALQQMLNRNCTRQKFSQRFRNIIDRYNAGGSENEDYYEQLLQLIEDLKAEDKRPEAEGLSEEELEIFDLLIAGKKLTKAEEQKVKLSAKNLFKKLSEEKSELMVVDWYKDEQPRAKVKTAIETSLDADLPLSYDKETFTVKIDLLLTHFIDMAVQGYGWVAA